MTRWRAFVWGAHLGAFVVIYVARYIEYRRAWAEVEAQIRAWAESMDVMFPSPKRQSRLTDHQ